MIEINGDKYFFATAPGSTEMYLIQEWLKDEYMLWCQCELFDEAWQRFADFFRSNEIIFKICHAAANKPA